MSVWKSDETLLSICILNFSFKNDFVWEEISNIRHSVSSPDETPRSSSKILRCASYFSTLFSVFHLVIKHCISCLIYYVKYNTNVPGMFRRINSLCVFSSSEWCQLGRAKISLWSVAKRKRSFQISSFTYTLPTVINYGHIFKLNRLS